MPSLLRTEAEHRASLLTVHHTDVDLRLTLDDTFTSTTTIAFTADSDDITFVDFAGVELVRATLDERPLDTAGWADGRLPLQLAPGDHELVIDGVMQYSSDGEGLHRHVDPFDDRQYLYAMSFLDAAPRWFACFDQPDLKSTYTMTVETPEDDWLVRGNGPAERLDERHWRLDQQRPLSTYFVTIVAGPYASVAETHDGIHLEILARQGLGRELGEQADDVLAMTRASFDAYHEMFGIRYPFGDYVQAFVPDFNAGAMENPGCVTFREQMIFRGQVTTSEIASRAGTIAHEMAHQWFGDLVTMRWWDDLWLNESFAEYMAQRVISDHTSHDLWTDFGIVRKDWGSIADQAPTTHPVAATEAPDAASSLQNFDGISYAKGAAVLKQLVASIGDDVFLTGLRDYFDRYAYGNAAMEDLMAAWQRAGADHLAEWVRAWLRTAGMDLLATSRDAGGLAVTRTTPDNTAPNNPDSTDNPNSTDRPPRPHAIQVAALDADGTEIARVGVELTTDRTAIHLPDAHTIVPDAHDETWARFRFADGWRLPTLSSVANPATRTVLYNAIKDGVRSTDLDPAVALDMLEDALPGEPAVVIQLALLSFATSLAAVWSPPELRQERRARVAALAETILDGAMPGSDRQLAALRTVLQTTTQDARLASWLADEDDAVDLDADLRWLAVRRLVMLGASPDLVDVELERDRSSAGRLAAVRARAAIPTAEAKRAALDTVVTAGGASAYDLYATAENLFLSEQVDLTADLVERWFSGIVATAEFRHGWVLGRVASASFPDSHASDELLTMGRLALGHPGLHSTLHRTLVEGLDRAERIVASHHRFGR